MKHAFARARSGAATSTPNPRRARAAAAVLSSSSGGNAARSSADVHGAGSADFASASAAFFAAVAPPSRAPLRSASTLAPARDGSTGTRASTAATSFVARAVALPKYGDAGALAGAAAAAGGAGGLDGLPRGVEEFDARSGALRPSSAEYAALRPIFEFKEKRFGRAKVAPTVGT